MAGMLPGVECVRRRRSHFGGSADSDHSTLIGSRRSSFCLYATGVELRPGRCSTQRTILSREIQDEALGDTAREAKDRLDAKLRVKRNGKSEEDRNQEQQVPVLGNGRGEVFAAMKSARKFSWSRLWQPGQADFRGVLRGFHGRQQLNSPAL